MIVGHGVRWGKWAGGGEGKSSVCGFISRVCEIKSSFSGMKSLLSYGGPHPRSSFIQSELVE